MGRSTNTEARRAQIADALIGLLGRASFAETSVATIAKAAGLAHGLVHHHFSSKEEVLELAVERLAVQLELRLQSLLRATGDDPHARVDAFIDAWLSLGDGADPRAALAWVAVGEEARRSATVKRVYVEALERSRAHLIGEIGRCLSVKGRVRARPIAEAIVVAIEGALRAGAAGGLQEGSAAPMVHAIFRALVRDERSR